MTALLVGALVVTVVGLALGIGWFVVRVSDVGDVR
jgi:hypothetical protein